MGKTRKGLYRAARILGDLEAISKGRVGRRVMRRTAGKMTGKALKGSGCFIATATYGTAMADEVRILSQFRDQYLKKHLLTRAFVKIYYAVSPGVATFIQRHEIFKAITRLALAPVIYFLR